MNPIETAANISVGRACGFASLAVICVVMGLSFDPILATRVGGVLCLIITLVLLMRANTARQRPYKRTELWLILPKRDKPPEAFAQRVIGEALREVYLRFARTAVIVSMAFVAVSLLLSLSEIVSA